MYKSLDNLAGGGDVMYLSRCTPWKLYVPPFAFAPGVYNVGGNAWMTSYLIDTGDGLVLIDAELHECVYLILENIRSLGYDPHDIKHIFVTHAHIDHIGGISAMKALTGAKVYMGKRDYHFLKNPLLVGAGHDVLECVYEPFEPDYFYEDLGKIKIGKFEFETENAAGHTPGTTAFFFDVCDTNGKTLRCGLHGGLGTNTMLDEYFNKTGEPVTLRDEFLEGLDRFSKMHVDVCLPSHLNQTGAAEQIDKITSDFNPFDNPQVWTELMEFSKQRLLSVPDVKKYFGKGE